MNCITLPSAELESHMGRERANTVESVSLIDQYESLGVVTACFRKCAAQEIVEDPYAICSSRASSRVFVDLVQDDCSPICIPEPSDVSTECSDQQTFEDLDDACELGSAVNVHVDIDEEDDDVYFSLHRQEEPDEQHVATIYPQRAHIDIDEEDDEIFFSLLQCERHLPEDELKTYHHAGCNNDAAEELSVHEHGPHVDESTREQCPGRMDSKRAPSSEDRDCMSVLLRPVASSDDEERSAADSRAPSLLAHLKGGRAQGVRNHLARKMTAEVVIAIDKVC